MGTRSSCVLLGPVALLSKVLEDSNPVCTESPLCTCPDDKVSGGRL